jgi:predicted transposase/invertase (TIGR01784 family)
LSVKLPNNFVKLFNNEKEEFMQTVAQEYIDQGLQKGKQEGKMEGKLEEKRAIARRMLRELHLDLNFVQNITKLTQEELKQLL